MSAKRGFLLMNVGSPDSTQEADVQRYLKEVMKAPHLNDLPSALHEILVNGIDLSHRPTRSAEAYKTIWTSKGSPLIQHCKAIRNGLRKRIDAPIEMGMAFGNPSFKMGIGKLLDSGVDEIGLLPMYPQYSVVTFGACVDAVTREMKHRRNKTTIRLIPPFFDDPNFINPLAQSLTDEGEHVLFSFLGLTLHHLKKPDLHGHCLSSMECCAEASGAHDTCYRFQSLSTAREIARVANMDSGSYSVSFQSRRNHGMWMEPHTEIMLQELPGKGYKRLAVICPTFLCDGLETLEEVDIRGKETFLNAGGESFRRIPCLNDSPEGLYCLEAQMMNAGSWPVLES